MVIVSINIIDVYLQSMNLIKPTEIDNNNKNCPCPLIELICFNASVVYVKLSEHFFFFFLGGGGGGCNNLFALKYLFINVVYHYIPMVQG